MTKLQELELKKERLHKLIENPKNIKSPGVIKKLTRQVRNLENEVK